MVQSLSHLAKIINELWLKIQGRVQKVFGLFTEGGFYNLGFERKERSLHFGFYSIFTNKYFEEFSGKVPFLSPIPKIEDGFMRISEIISISIFLLKNEIKIENREIKFGSRKIIKSERSWKK